MEEQLGERRKFPKTNARQIVDYNNVITKLGQKGIFCIDIGLLPIIRQFMGTRGLWRTSYAVSIDDDGYDIPDSTQFSPIDRAIKEFLTEAVDMSCDITTGLEGIEDAIRTLQQTQSSCGGCGTIGAGGSGQYEQPPTGFIDDGSSNYPDGFESRADYDSFKCSAAYLIWQLVRQDMIFIQNTDATAITAAILAATLVSPIPFDELAALGLLIAQLIVEATLDTILGNLIDAWENAETDIICALYTAADESAALQGVTDFLDTQLTAIEETFLGFIFTSDAARWLFSKPAILLPDYDCSVCIDTCSGGLAQYGTITAQTANSLTIESAYSAGNNWHWARVWFNTETFGSPYCGDMVTINSMTSSNNLQDWSNNRPYSCTNDSANFVYQNGPLASGSIANVRYVTLLSRVGQGDGPFSVDITWS